MITIETAAIAVIAAGLKTSEVAKRQLGKLLTTGAIICFVISIAAAALLLLSVPEIAQTLQPDTNIWLTRDSAIGRVFGMDTQGFAIVESFFFGLGVVLFAALVIALAWFPVVPKK